MLRQSPHANVLLSLLSITAQPYIEHRKHDAIRYVVALFLSVHNDSNFVMP